MFGVCALCEREADLRHSHIVPEFFERRLKEDSGTPFFRGIEANRRTQSGPKLWLLCDECERQFSDAEAEFAKTFYHPTRDGGQFEIVWTRGLARFVASISWRNLVFKLRLNDRATSDLRPEDWLAMEAAEVRQRDYLMGRSVFPRQIPHHVFTSSGRVVTTHSSMNTYFNMAIMTSTPASNDSTYSLVVVPGLVFIALLNPTEECIENWTDTGTLAVPGGTMRNYQQTIKDRQFMTFMIEQAKTFDRQHATLSPKQQDAIAKEARRNLAVKRPNSVIAQAWLQDLHNRRQATTGELP